MKGLEQDIQVLKERMAELLTHDTINYKDIYKIKIEMDELIDKYYFEQM